MTVLLLLGGVTVCLALWLLALWLGQNNGEVRTGRPPRTDPPRRRADERGEPLQPDL
jgi:hypothetical protein